MSRYFLADSILRLTRLVPYGIPKFEGNDEGDLIINGREIAAVFEPVVAQILKLIKAQIQIVKKEHFNAEIAGILLVGGLGRNRYLMARVQKEFKSSGYEVLQPLNG